MNIKSSDNQEIYKYQSEGEFSHRLLNRQVGNTANKSLGSENFKSTDCNVESTYSLAIQQKNIKNIKHNEKTNLLMTGEHR